MADPIIIYTDGAASGNPGPGGFGVVLKAGVYRKELMAGFRRTTNNRMELLAVIVGLEALKQPGWQVVVYSDSRYVVEAVEKGWVFGWEKKGFKDKKTHGFVETLSGYIPATSGEVRLGKRTCRYPRKRTL